MARELKVDVDLFTKYGADCPKQYLNDNKINLTNPDSSKNTTKFSISITGSDRTLKIANECEPIEYSDVNENAHIVSPIFHEISQDVFKKIKQNSNFLFVDPQGFLRQKDSENNIFLQKTDLDLTNVDAIKINPEEGQNIVEGTNDEMMLALQKKGIEHVILTNKTDVSILVKNRVYYLKLPNKRVNDTTGIGDIFCYTF